MKPARSVPAATTIMPPAPRRRPARRGPVTIAQLAVNKPANAQSAAILGQNQGAARWRMNLGDTAPESSPQTGCNFRIERYTNAGAFIDFPVYIERSTGQVTLTSNPVPTTTQPPGVLALNSDNVTPSALQGRNSGIVHWQISLGDGTSASDFRLNRYNDSGTLIDVPLWINRATGVTTVTGSPPDQGAILTINKTSGSGLMASSIQGQTATKTRWHLALGDGAVETGTNVGSGLQNPQPPRFRHVQHGGVLHFPGDRGRRVFHRHGLQGRRRIVRHASDARIKTVVGEYETGLAEVMGCGRCATPTTAPTSRGQTRTQKVGKGEPNPDSDHYAVARDGAEYIGLIAQEAEIPMPEMVVQTSAEIDGVPVDDYRIMDTGSLVFALVNAVKELNTMVQQLHDRIKNLEAART